MTGDFWQETERSFKIEATDADHFQKVTATRPAWNLNAKVMTIFI